MNHANELSPKNSPYNEYGNEFRVNDNGIMYPAYMPLRYLRKMAERFIDLVAHTPDYAEVKVSKIHDGKGLSWELTVYSEDPVDKDQVWMSRKYTFDLYPAWKAIGFHDHWLSLWTPRCEEMKRTDEEIQQLVTGIQAEMRAEYQDRSLHPQLDKDLRNSNWTNILSVSKRSFPTQAVKKDRMAREIRKNAEVIQKARQKKKPL